MTYHDKIEEAVEYLKSIAASMKMKIDDRTKKFGLWLVGVHVDESTAFDENGKTYGLDTTKNTYFCQNRYGPDKKVVCPARISLKPFNFNNMHSETCNNKEE